MSHRQRGHLETAPPFTVPCKGREARLIHHTHQESNSGLSRGSPLHYRCTTPAPLSLCTEVLGNAIRQEKSIVGITIRNNDFENTCTTKLSQYADDTTLFLDGQLKSIKAVLN